jgi:two-component system, NtrC family, response regulator AtoC
MSATLASDIPMINALPPDNVIFGGTPAMSAIRANVLKIADTNIPVLIEGESGTGKEIIAKYIHRRSVWEAGPFVKINCPAIPATLLESELFGYEKGAFTGAFGSKPGRVAMANCGVLFLDEISELAIELQSKLLQLLQDGQFSPIGGRETMKVDVRIICATNRQLQQEVAGGRFRQDLLYRINVVVLHLPPLRERAADIPVLVNYFLAQLSRTYKRNTQPLSASAMNRLKVHHWPGNIRELENLMKRYVVLGTEDVIMSDLTAPALANFIPQLPRENSVALKKLTRAAVKDLEGKIILNTLQAHQWNRKRAARALNISYRSLLYKLKESGLDLRHGQAAQAHD